MQGETHNKYARKLAKEVGGLGNLVHIVGTHHFIPLAMALTKKQAAISIYIRHHTLKPYCTTYVCEAVTQDEDGEDQSIEDPEDEIDVLLMDPHKVTQWEQYEKELEPPIMDNSTLYGTQLEQHAKVIQVLDSSQEHGQSPTEVLAKKYLAGDQYVVKNIRTLAHVCSIAFMGAGQQDHISQQQFLQLLYQLAQKIRQPGTYPYQPTCRASGALTINAFGTLHEAKSRMPEANIPPWDTWCRQIKDTPHG